LDQYTLKKADPETFSFLVSYIFAKKQALFDICGLMQSQKSSYQMIKQFTIIKRVHAFGNS